MTKRNFKSPALQHKNKWSENFHEFLKYALQKEPKKRPAAQELLRVREGERKGEREGRGGEGRGRGREGGGRGDTEGREEDACYG